jgi:hypothetical protein
MALEVLSEVRVTKQSCCIGFPRGTVCQIIQVYEEPKGGKLYLCYPLNKEGLQVAMWQCAKCLEPMEKENAGTQG